jgi:hypothetical protein
MPRPRRFFPPEYKAEVVELIRSTGWTVGQVAKVELTRSGGLLQPAGGTSPIREGKGLASGRLGRCQ